jgi:hypothetical protein
LPVSAVTFGQPAALAGLQKGDVIASVNGTNLRAMEHSKAIHVLNAAFSSNSTFVSLDVVRCSWNGAYNTWSPNNLSAQVSFSHRQRRQHAAWGEEPTAHLRCNHWPWRRRFSSCRRRHCTIRRSARAPIGCTVALRFRCRLHRALHVLRGPLASCPAFGSYLLSSAAINFSCFCAFLEDRCDCPSFACVCSRSNASCAAAVIALVIQVTCAVSSIFARVCDLCCALTSC